MMIIGAVNKKVHSKYSFYIFFIKIDIFTVIGNKDHPWAAFLRIIYQIQFFEF